MIRRFRAKLLEFPRLLIKKKKIKNGKCLFFFSKNINEKKRLTLRLCSILNSIYHGISYPWYFLPSKQSILVLYVCGNHLHMEMKLSSVQLLVNYMNKLYVILNCSTVGFIFEMGSDR